MYMINNDNLKKTKNIKILLRLIDYVDINTDILNLNGIIFDEILDKNNIARSTLHNAINYFTKNDILLKTKYKSIFQLNMYYFIKL